MTRLLIADDHPFVIAGLEAILRDTAFDVVGTCADGQAVLDALPRLRPDLLLLDVSMPVCSGIDVLRILRSRGEKIAIVLLTAGLDDRQLIEAIEREADGIVLKESAKARLLDCLAAVREGGRWIEPDLLRRSVDVQRGVDCALDLLAPLSPSERAVVTLVGEGLRNKEIAARLGVTEGSIKVYLHRIYGKTGVNNRTELALKATGAPRRTS